MSHWKHLFKDTKEVELATKTFDAFANKKMMCFLLMEMSVHQTLSEHTTQTKKLSKEETRKKQKEALLKRNKKSKKRKPTTNTKKEESEEEG